MEGRAKDAMIPLILIGIGLAIYAVAGFALAGPGGAGATLIGLLIAVAVGVVLGIVALYITAAIMSIDFGPLGQAILKLCAIFVFSGAVAEFIPVPILGWLVSLGLYLWLLAWLFELEPLETIVCALVILGVRIAVGIFLLAAIMSMM